jgi:hypothetical protein
LTPTFQIQKNVSTFPCFLDQCDEFVLSWIYVYYLKL